MGRDSPINGAKSVKARPRSAQRGLDLLSAASVKRGLDLLSVASGQRGVDEKELQR
jgi:hypothetical protein